MQKQELLLDYVADMRELLDNAEGSLLTGEQHVTRTGRVDAELLNEIFRFFHTIKGTSGFFAFTTIVNVAHQAETLLDQLRSGSITFQCGVAEKLVQVCDFLRSLIDAVAQTGTDAGHEVAASVIAAGLARLLPAAPEPAPEKEQRWGLFETTPPPSPAVATSTTSERQDIRIATTKLDAMMNLVGELVVAEMLVTQHKDLQNIVSSDFTGAARQLGKIVRHLQEAALSLRMVPLTAVFQRMTRLVWDLSRKSGKKAVFQIEGEDTEVDKTIAELISDPLVHILRNCVDHGLESAEVRSAAGKSDTGTISLRARHAGGEVQISVQDDGHGLDRSKILARAAAQGLITGNGDNMADDAVWELIFLPGFSTAEKVTDISGRGVGMDVVRKNLTALNGRIDVQSKPGQGTSFVLGIPLTLAIIEGLVARIGSAHFIIPTTDILKSLMYSSVNVTRLDQGEELGEFCGQFFPVLSLASVLNMPCAQETLAEKSLIVRVGRDANSVGIVVDEILGNQHIVVKPLHGLVKNSRGVSGCTILGDGSVALIVDVGHLTKVVSCIGARGQNQPEALQRAAL